MSPYIKSALAVVLSPVLVASAQFIENVDRIGSIAIPHMKRQVISDDTADSAFDVLHRQSYFPHFLQVFNFPYFFATDLSGNSPYFNSPGVGLTPSVPSGCNVSAAALFIRHTDIYANDYEYENSLAPLISKLANFSSKNAWARDDALAFLVNWTSPIDDPDAEIEETTIYGREDAKALGGLVAGRYESLLSGSGEGFNVWTADADRDQVKTQSSFSNKEDITLTLPSRKQQRLSLRV